MAHSVLPGAPMRAVACVLLLVCGATFGCARTLPACTTAPLLQRPPLDEGDFLHVVPLGNLNPPGHTLPTDHVYLTLPLARRLSESARPEPAVVPVYAPGALRVLSVQRRDFLDGPRRGASEYKLRMAACAEVVFTMDHLLALAPRFAERVAATGEQCQMEGGGAGSRFCRRATDIEVVAGEPIGFAGGAGQYALDLGARDERSVSGVAGVVANPARHDGSRGAKDDLHAACPIDYFEPQARAALLDRAGGFDPEAHRTIEPRCGSVAQDRPGTAQGAWFRRGAPTLPEAPHLALVHDNVDPTRPVVSSGTSLPGLQGAHRFEARGDGMINRDFSSLIADGVVYCYEELEGASGSTLLLQLVDDNHLRAEVAEGDRCGAGPWHLSARAVDFER